MFVGMRTHHASVVCCESNGSERTLFIGKYARLPSGPMLNVAGATLDAAICRWICSTAELELCVVNRLRATISARRIPFRIAAHSAETRLTAAARGGP